ncbi:hypothetical protein [Granulicella tundricola]|uniref:Lipoprotein n=1 Tax=Granulicella tundricola (strain ATCC BAA-1859 / DSM 23138 / MP5ACTX9) TaxID=1198114 RepID=E8WWY6_GRATM|nr:hypothetical protein [Granulicella tundricola]ADW68547.1 hypothetical protein AciX9_1494 [Granulicella tundricola MP5ACTX9]
MRLLRLIGCGLGLGLVGCHSAYVDATLVNGTDKPLSLVELDYPSASFGTQTLAPGGTFHYRFKVLGSGALKLIYTDTKEKEIDVKGPELHEGDEGSLTVTVGAAGTSWDEKLKNRK